MSYKELLLVGSVPFDTVEEVDDSIGGPLRPLSPGHARWRGRRTAVLGQSLLLSALQRPCRSRDLEAAANRSTASSSSCRGHARISGSSACGPMSSACVSASRSRGSAMRAMRSPLISSSRRCARKACCPPGCASRSRSRWSTASCARSISPIRKTWRRIRPGFEEALAAELDVIVKHIPAKDLAVQWDMAWEIQAVSGAAQTPDEAKVETHTAPVARLSKHLPDGVALGFHFCFGTFGGWPAFAPETLGPTVDLANASIEAARRRVDWVHIPVLDTTEHKFYAPLIELEPRAAMSISAPSIRCRHSRRGSKSRANTCRASASPPIAASAARRRSSFRSSSPITSKR